MSTNDQSRTYGNHIDEFIGTLHEECMSETHNVQVWEESSQKGTFTGFLLMAGTVGLS